MDHTRSSTAASKETSRSPKPHSSKASLASTSTNPSTRIKSPSPSPHCHEKPNFSQTLERMKTYEEKNRFAFERSKQFLEQQQALECLPATPNPVSRKLAQGLPSLHRRYPEVLSSREKKLESLRIETERREKDKEDRESRPLASKSPHSGRPSVSPERFYDYSTQWSKTVSEKTTVLREQATEKELSEATFAPKINPSQGSHSPLHKRMDFLLTSREEKRKEVERSLTPTFTPKTNVVKGKKQGARETVKSLKSILPDFRIPPKTRSN